MFIDILITALATACACGTIGALLVLRGVALMSDAISHTVIFGIVSAYLITRTFNSVVLTFGAICAGILTVWMTEMLIATRRVYKEVAIGLVFPFLFSLGAILVCFYTASLHLDIDMVLLGEISLIPLKRMVVCGCDLGPWAFFVMICVALCNILFIVGNYRLLQIYIFDPLTASLYYKNRSFLYYCMIVFTSVTMVSALEVVGSLVTVALMVVPAAIALLHEKSMYLVLVFCVGYAGIMAIGGTTIGYLFDLSVGGCMVLVGGLLLMFRLGTLPKRNISV